MKVALVWVVDWSGLLFLRSGVGWERVGMVGFGCAMPFMGGDGVMPWASVARRAWRRAR
jgi:hypothetical protein